MATAKLTEQGFFETCDKEHCAFFGDLMARWRNEGQEVRFQSTSAVLRAGTTNLCTLYPSYRNRGAAVRFDLEGLRKAYGRDWVTSLDKNLRSLDELQVGSGKKDLIIQAPACSSLHTHEAFKQELLQRA